MFDSQVLENSWTIGALLVVGVLLVAALAWLLGRSTGSDWRAGELRVLAWISIRHIRRVFVLLAAGTLALVGVALLVLPGPGLLVLSAALALLATEFVWARRWVNRLRDRLGALGKDARGFFESGDDRPPD